MADDLDGHAYTYSGLTLAPQPWLPALAALRDELAALTGARYNRCASSGLHRSVRLSLSIALTCCLSCLSLSRAPCVLLAAACSITIGPATTASAGTLTTRPCMALHQPLLASQLARPDHGARRRRRARDGRDHAAALAALRAAAEARAGAACQPDLPPYCGAADGSRRRRGGGRLALVVVPMCDCCVVCAACNLACVVLPPHTLPRPGRCCSDAACTHASVEGCRAPSKQLHHRCARVPVSSRLLTRQGRVHTQLLK